MGKLGAWRLSGKRVLPSRARPSASPHSCCLRNGREFRRGWHIVDAGESAREHHHIAPSPPLAVFVFGVDSRLASLLTHTLDTPLADRTVAPARPLGSFQIEQSATRIGRGRSAFCELIARSCSIRIRPGARSHSLAFRPRPVNSRVADQREVELRVNRCVLFSCRPRCGNQGSAVIGILWKYHKPNSEHPGCSE